MSEGSVPKTEVQVTAKGDVAAGCFSNNMLISYNAEEVVLDWLNNTPSGPHLVARVVVTPGHLKRIVDVLQKSLQQYVERFGAPPEKAEP